MNFERLRSTQRGHGVIAGLQDLDPRDSVAGTTRFVERMSRDVLTFTRSGRLWHRTHRLADGQEKALGGTGEHPFRVQGRSRSVAASKLQVGNCKSESSFSAATSRSPCVVGIRIEGPPRGDVRDLQLRSGGRFTDIAPSSTTPLSQMSQPLLATRKWRCTARGCDQQRQTRGAHQARRRRLTTSRCGEWATSSSSWSSRPASVHIDWYSANV